MAAALQALSQTMLPFYQPVTTRVTYSPAFRPAELAGSGEAAAVNQVITDHARRLIEKIQNRREKAQPMSALTHLLSPSQEER
jgi:hypothetical protein